MLPGKIINGKSSNRAKSKFKGTGKNAENADVRIVAATNKDIDSNGKINTIGDEIKSGRSFWEVVKAPFLDRELNRSEVKEIINRGLLETGGKYKGLLKLFNLEEKEYKNFMRFLYENRLK